MTGALKLESITQIGKTDSDVLREIVKQLGGRRSAFIPYKDIQAGLGIENRETVRKSVNRMKANGIVAEENGELSVPGLVFANG